MAKTEHPMQALAAYLPENCFDEVVHFLVKYKVHLTISRSRKSVLGNYRSAYKGDNHKISVNGNLNKFSFLITLLHELAHLLTFEKYGAHVQSHGKEWKRIYSFLLKDFIDRNIFPADIVAAIKKSLHNPGASACAEEDVMRVLRKYDEHATDKVLLETLPHGQLFLYSKHYYKKGNKRTKRYECIDVKTGRMYLFSPICEVEAV